jgi:hypothetical protein
MNIVSWIFNQQQSPAAARRMAGSVGVALLLLAATAAVAQNPAEPAPESKFTTPEGYTAHHTLDMGGRMSNQVGSGAMYDTLVNLQSGPRVQGESLELHALATNKHPLVDDLSAFGSGFGGDPNIVARLSASKTRVYEFSGLFRRDRLYSNYDLLANLNIPGTGLYTDIGPSNAPTGTLPWSQMTNSPVMFNTVRRMTDTSLTLKPFSTFTYRLAYSHFTMEGPTSSPAYTPLGMKYAAVARQWERNGSDDYTGAIDWKPNAKTKVTLEVEGNHYKADTFFTLDPSLFTVQEADGTPAYLGNYYSSFDPPGISSCNTASMGTGNYTSTSVYTMLTAANIPGGLPIVNPACAVITSYLRTQPTRIWTPTETIRFQSSAIKNISMNGHAHYTSSTSNMPSYYEGAQGLNGIVRSAISSGGYASTRRAVFGLDYGLVWQASSTVSVSDQVDYSSVKEPGYSNIPNPVTLSTPALTTGNATITYAGALTTGTGSLPHGNTGALGFNFYGQSTVSNTATVAWDATSRARFSLAYRYTSRKIGQGATPVTSGGVTYTRTGPLDNQGDPYIGQLTINQNAGIFNAALRPAKNWTLNGTVEISYDDNALTPVSPRQAKLYRMHTTYKPNGYTTITASYSDRERHNNTNNAADLIASGTVYTYQGPLNHIDYSRVGSIGVVLAPKETYSFDFNYSYSDVYTATNTCFTNYAYAAVTTLTPNVPAIAGAAPETSSGAASLCKPTSATAAPEWAARDFEDAPTQFVSAAVSLTPNKKVNSNIGYTISDVSGSRFFNDPRDVNGMLNSKYQTPFLNVAYTMHPGLIWKAQYDYFGYGEGGASGAQTCTTTAITAANASTIGSTIVPCASLTVPTGLTEGAAGATAPRTFHANNVTLGVHWEF